MISELSQRLSRAEQSLASSATSATTTSSSSKGPSTQQHHLTPAPSNAPAEGPASHAGYESLDELSLDHQTSYFPDFDSSLQPGKDGDGMMPGLDLSDLDWENMCGMDLYQPSPYDAIQPVPTSAPAQNCWAEEPTEQAEHEIYQLYFDLADYACYMLDRDAFTATMSTPPLGPELLSLKHIVLAHGASVSPAHRQMHAHLYEKSRRSFETVETGTAFATLPALQACILLATYELKHMFFSRAWRRISRAIWMAQAFGLHRMDAASSSNGGRMPPSPLATTTQPAEMEERRRTFWSAFILSCFVSTSAGWNMHALVDHYEITTFLPHSKSRTEARSDLASALESSMWMPAIRELSPFQALILSSALYSRCLGHADSARGTDQAMAPSYDFWMHHHHISEVVNVFASLLYRDKKAALTIHIRTQAILVCLHHAAVQHESKLSPGMGPRSQSQMKCFNSAVEVTNVMQQILREVNDPATLSPYDLWSIYVAMQFYVRQWHALPIEVRSSISSEPLFVSNNVPSRGGSDCLQSNGLCSPIHEAPPTGSHLNPWVLQDCISRLLSTLKSFEHANPIAGVFESQIRQELLGGKALTDMVPVGRVKLGLEVNLVGQEGTEDDFGFVGLDCENEIRGMGIVRLQVFPGQNTASM